MTEKQYTIVNMGLDGQYIKENGKIMTIERVVDLLNENEQLKSKNRGLQSELQIFKEDVTHSNLQINKLAEKNEQLKKQLDYIQNSISEHIKHQKTELGQKALQEIIADYNEWLLGHKEAKE